MDPVEVGARTGFCWSGPALRLAGIGRPTRIGVEELAAAATESCGCPVTGGVAMVAQPFDGGAEPSAYVAPITVVADDTGTWLKLADPGVTQADAEDRIRHVLAEPPESVRPSSISVASPIDAASWRDDIVAPVIERIRSGEVDKVVLARELVVQADRPIDPGLLLGRLARRFPTVQLFCVDGFVGASPEMLVARHGSVVTAHPLAGTAPRSSNPDQDDAMAAELRGAKNQAEHRVTIDWLLDSLLPFCSYIDAEPEPTIVTLSNVHHLGTRVEGRLSQPPASVLDLSQVLHPTPALGGAPRDQALDIISEVEGFDRGRFGGPVGWVDGAGNGELAVGIRSAQIDGNTAKVWAGVGVVADSDPESELAETRSKFQAVLGSLVEL